MGTIQSNVGILSGIPITDTVNQLMAIAARPRDDLKTRNDDLGKQQAALTEITALSISLQLSAVNLGKDATYDKQTASVSSDKLAATITGTATPGAYQFTPARLAQNQHLLGTGLASVSTALGAGSLVFHVGSGDPVTVTIDADDTLNDLVTKINDANAGVSASVINDGSGTPYRLSLISQKSGSAGQVTVTTPPPGIAFTEVAAALDAQLYIGTPGSGVLVTSSTNTFENVLPGVSLTIKDTSTDPVTVTTAATDASLVTQAKLFVDNYNKLVDKIDSYTSYDAATDTKGLLFGSGDVVRIQSELSNIVTGRHFGLGAIQSLSELGFNVSSEGKLSLDDTKFKAKYADDPAAVRKFFTTSTTGVAAQLNAAMERIAGRDNSVLINRIQSIQRKMDFNSERLDFMTSRLDKQRERLTNQFYTLDALVGKMKSQTGIIAGIQSLASSSG
jgi:flagellar hook-associated protein 2